MARNDSVRGATIEIRQGGDVYTIDTSDDDGGTSCWVGNIWDGLPPGLSREFDEFAALAREYVASTDFFDACHAEWRQGYDAERGIR